MFAPLLDVEASFCVAGARDSPPCQKSAKREGFVAVSTTVQPPLHYTTLHFTSLHSITLHYTALHYTRLRYTTLHYITLLTPPQMQLQLHYTNYTTPQLQLHYTTTTTTAALHHATTTTTAALHHTTSSSCGEVTTEAIATTPENTTPTTFQSISGFALPSVIHNNQPLI